MHVEERWGEKVITQLSKDLQQALPGVEGLSRTNIYYCKKFYLLYNQDNEFFRQLGVKLDNHKETGASEIVHQVAGQFEGNVLFQQLTGIFQIPWRPWSTWYICCGM